MNYLTITLKLNKPSREKRRILNEAMENYTKAFDFLLREAEKEDFSLESRKAGGKHNLAKWVGKDLSSRLNEFHAEPFKDSLKLDFAMTMSGYLELKARGKKTGYPAFYSNDIGELTGLRPIFFCRYDTNRDYCILYDSVKDRYYAKLYLMNQKTARRNASPAGESRLEHIHKNRQKLERRISKDRYIIVPLSFGKWQEQYLKTAMDDPGLFKTARLNRRGEDYYLTINMGLPAKEIIKTSSYLGISRGPENSLAVAVTDSSGAVMELDFIELYDHTDRDGGNPTAELYIAAKKIVEKASANHSQVIVENLAYHSDGIYEVEFNSGKGRNIFRRACYQTLERILDYKLVQSGLPKPIRVSPIGIFSTCPICGLNTKKSRSSRGMFLCVSCGAVYNLRTLGSINLANRLIKYHADTIKIKVTKEKNMLHLRNETLELELQTTAADDVMEQLNRKITDLVRDARENHSPVLNRREYKKKWSMIRKIESMDDLSKHITFI